MRVFVDTNIIVSSILFPRGTTATVFNHIIKHHELIIPSFCIVEANIVFSRKFPDKCHLLEQFFLDLDFELFHTPESVSFEEYPQIRDPCDYPVLVSAILSDSDVLLTGDKDFEGVEIAKPLIFSPSQYFELIRKKRTGSVAPATFPVPLIIDKFLSTILIALNTYPDPKTPGIYSVLPVYSRDTPE